MTDVIHCEVVEDIINVNIVEDVFDVQISGDVFFSLIKHEYVSVPETRDSYGIPGQMSFDDDYFYLCVAPNRWARILLMKGW